MKAIILLLLLGGIDLPSGTFTNEVDLIECNTMHCENGFPMFTQIIYWDWSRLHNGFIVRAWKMNNEVWVKSDEHKKEWEAALRKYCDENRHVPFSTLKGRYKGEFDPVPGMNFPIKKTNRDTGEQYWEHVFYSDGKRIVVIAKSFRVTHTQNDPERDNRAEFPESARKGLRGYNNDGD